MDHGIQRAKEGDRQIMNTPNSQMQAILDVYAELGPLPIESLTAEQARVVPLPDRAAFIYYGTHFAKKELAPMPPPVAKVTHKLIPGGNGGLVARIYTPQDDAPDGGWPIAVYFHGGGWVIANLDTYDGSARSVAVGAQCVVASVHYRQAPENPWPAAAEDAFASYKWAVENAASLGGDPSRVAVIGESAGGNLAAVFSLMARDNRVQLPVQFPASPGGLQLIGARLVRDANDDAAYVAFQVDGRPVSLLVSPHTGGSGISGRAYRRGRLTFQVSKEKGLRVITWEDNHLNYALVSPISQAPSAACAICHSADG